MHFIAFSFEAASDGNLSHLHECTTPKCEYIAIIDDEMSFSEHPYHILFLCVVISKKFPRLLAEREIIANAFSNMSHRHLHRGIRQCSRGKDTKNIRNDKTFSVISIKKGPGLLLSQTIMMCFVF